MTATGALIARHVTDLFPTQTSRFDLAQAARRGVIAPLRCVRIPPGPGVRTIAKVPLRRGEVDTEFDQELLAELLDQLPFNMAIADLYKTRFNGVPGVVYAAGVRHAYNVAEAFRDAGLKAQAVSGETPKRELATILARYERGDIDVLVNAQLLAEGWNSPRATVCMHLAPTASKRIYQQRVGRVTRRHLGKEAGIVVDFVHPATKHDDPVVTLHSLLDRDVYRGGAIVVGPVRRGRGRRVRVERRVLPVTDDENRRIEVFERELWRIAVEHLDYGEQVEWAALAGARVAPSGWRRARAMLHFDRTGELKRAFLLTAVQRNKNSQLRIKALQEIAASRDAEAFDQALDVIGGWQREERREGSKVMLQALVEKRIGRRDQATAWIWRIASYTSELHEEYAVQRWPETKRLLGLLVNSSGGAHARNARRLVHATRKQDRRLSAALLAAARAHTPEAEEVLRGARTRMARKPGALSRELLRNFPRGAKGRRGKRRKRKGGEEEGVVLETAVLNGAALQPDDDFQETAAEQAAEPAPVPDEAETLARIRDAARALASARGDAVAEPSEPTAEDVPAPPRRRRRVTIDDDGQPAVASDADALAKPRPKRPRRPRAKKAEEVVEAPEVTAEEAPAEPEKPKRTRRPRTKAAEAPEVTAEEAPAEPEKPKRTRRPRTKAAEAPEVTAEEAPAEPEKPKRTRRPRAKAAEAPSPRSPRAAPLTREGGGAGAGGAGRGRGRGRGAQAEAHPARARQGREPEHRAHREQGARAPHAQAARVAGDRSGLAPAQLERQAEGLEVLVAEEAADLRDPLAVGLEDDDRPRLAHAGLVGQLVLGERGRAVRVQRHEPGAPAREPLAEQPVADLLRAAQPQVVGRHGELRVLGQERDERGDVVALERVDVARQQVALGVAVDVRRGGRRVDVGCLDRRPRALQRAVDGRDARPQQLGHLAGLPPQDLAQDEDRALLRRQELQRGDERELDRLLRRGELRGVAVGGHDARVLDRQDPGLLHERRAERRRRGRRGPEVHRARAPLRALEHVEADVVGDAVEPRSQCLARIEPVGRAPRADHRLLDRVLGLGARPQHPVAVAGQLTAV